MPKNPLEVNKLIHAEAIFQRILNPDSLFPERPQEDPCVFILPARNYHRILSWKTLFFLVVTGEARSEIPLFLPLGINFFRIRHFFVQKCLSDRSLCCIVICRVFNICALQVTFLVEG